jgi:hypothetical protein
MPTGNIHKLVFSETIQSMVRPVTTVWSVPTYTTREQAFAVYEDVRVVARRAQQASMEFFMIPFKAFFAGGPAP